MEDGAKIEYLTEQIKQCNELFSRNERCFAELETEMEKSACNVLEENKQKLDHAILEAREQFTEQINELKAQHKFQLEKIETDTKKKIAQRVETEVNLVLVKFKEDLERQLEKLQTIEVAIGDKTKQVKDLQRHLEEKRRLISVKKELQRDKDVDCIETKKKEIADIEKKIQDLSQKWIQNKEQIKQKMVNLCSHIEILENKYKEKRALALRFRDKIRENKLLTDIEINSSLALTNNQTDTFVKRRLETMSGESIKNFKQECEKFTTLYSEIVKDSARISEDSKRLSSSN